MATDLPQFVPTTFGRYELIERIAIGGMAEIFRARQGGAHGFEKILVIKRMLPHLAADPEFLGMFIDEAKLQSALTHPKIVQVYEFGQVEGQYYIALEYVDGMDTLGVLRACAHRRQRLPVHLAVHIAAEVLDALDFAHARRGGDGTTLSVVHRDVSPSNVFISRRGDIKLGDFGIARASAEHRTSKTQAGTLKGKYGYMAPEQVVGGVIDGRTDQFAVGVVLAEMLMGRRLFTAPNDLDVLLMVRDARLDRLDRYGSDVPAPLRALLNRMLARDPAERFVSAGHARDALADYLFDSRQRVSTSDVGMFLEGLIAGEAKPPQSPDTSFLMGDETRESRIAADMRREEVRRVSQEMKGVPAPPAPPLVPPDAKGRRTGPTPPLDELARRGGRDPSGGTTALTPESRGQVIEPPPRARVPEELEAVDIEIDLADSGPFIEPASAPNLHHIPTAQLPAAMVAAVAGHPAAGLPSPDDTPDLGGSFADLTPARLFGSLATSLETGLLVLERGDVRKEVFFVEGTPEFVSSNVPNERFGEYLVGRGIISAGELSMALAILPRFSGKLGDTLVGLNLLRPLEVFRHLTRQVRDKLIEVFAWQSGAHRFYRGRVNDREAFPLGLDAYEILGAAVAGLSLEMVRAHLGRIGERKPLRAERVRPAPEAFRVGAGPRELWQRLDGKRTIDEWMKRYEQPEQLITLCRTLYLLVETDLVTLE